MTYNEKKSLYESIMAEVAKTVKRSIEEYCSSDNDSEIIEEGWKENIVAGALALASVFISPQQIYAKGMTNPSNKAKTEHVIADRQPSFPGGNEALNDFLQNNIKYPVEAEEKGIEGRVILSFIVNKDGSISGIHVVRGVHPLLDKEAIRVLKLMPRWIPGRKNGRATQERYTAPFTFNLKYDTK